MFIVSNSFKPFLFFLPFSFLAGGRVACWGSYTKYDDYQPLIQRDNKMI
jgi:hypothetical protein